MFGYYTTTVSILRTSLTVPVFPAGLSGYCLGRLQFGKCASMEEQKLNIEIMLGLCLMLCIAILILICIQCNMSSSIQLEKVELEKCRI